ncbi:TetR/AcrR family transcriptional regulator [Kitasatospora sp. NPDC050543]|uniref:TetR/AcrR family transcriptional regulator n=1 Tax=Kitasatospora sp. NPDC050543 TaxID=3364054 RepID=UPI00379B05AE
MSPRSTVGRPRRRPQPVRKDPSAIAATRPVDPTAAQQPATGTRRNEAARLAVLNAADDLLVERGFEALTIEGIAARAGVAKQTIYRWWKSKVDILYDNLILDGGEALTWPEPAAGAAYTVHELRGYLRRFAAFLGEDPAGRVLQALIGHAQLDSRTADLLYGNFLHDLTVRDRERVRQCLAGLDPQRTVTDEDAADVLDALLAPLYYRALLARGPIDPALVDERLDAVLRDHRDRADHNGPSGHSGHGA